MQQLNSFCQEVAATSVNPNLVTIPMVTVEEPEDIVPVLLGVDAAFSPGPVSDQASDTSSNSTSSEADPGEEETKSLQIIQIMEQMSSDTTAMTSLTEAIKRSTRAFERESCESNDHLKVSIVGDPGRHREY